jgi:alkylation response protein AidB-like acyl-CoA dehydrogenase
MELELTPDQDFFVATTRRFLEDRAAVGVLRGLRDDERGYDEAYWRQGCELGWTSLLVAEADGGGSISGRGVEDLALVAFEFGRHASPGPLVAANVVAAALSRSGTEAQKVEVLQKILAGEVVVGWAIAEPPPNDRLGHVALEAVPSGKGWSLTGTKAAVEAGGVASHLLVTARTGDGLTQLLVPADAPGVVATPMHSLDLTRRFSTVTFDGTTVPASALVGEAGGAAGDVARQLRLANVVLCAEMTGAMDKAMDITIEWAFDRYTFGRPLASYQALKHRFADMKTWLEASQAVTDGAATAVQDDADDADEAVSAAKAYIGHHGPEVVHECVQMHGGIGVTFEHDLHLYVRRVVLDAALHGTVNDHRLRLADILEARENPERPAA